MFSQTFLFSNSFADTKTAATDPLRTSNAYKEIADALRNASKRVREAKKAAEDAYLDADSKSETSMVNVAQAAKNQNVTIKQQADELSVADLENERLDATLRMSKLSEIATIPFC